MRNNARTSPVKMRERRDPSASGMCAKKPVPVEPDGRRAASYGVNRMSLTTISESGSDASSLAPAPQRWTDDEEVKLLQRIAEKRDIQALEALYMSYRPRLAGFLRRVTDDQETISESVNSVMYRVWNHAQQFSGNSKVSSWIFAIAYRECRRLADKEAKHARIVDAVSAESDLQESTTDSATADDRDVIQAALTELPTEQRLAIEMSYFLGKSIQEIAEVSKCPENTVKTRLFHARRKLRELIPAMSVS